MIEGISVIVCCYNSAELIAETLSCLAAQEGIDVNATELLLVNNNSSDDTVNIAQKTWQDAGSPYPLHIIDESEPGLSNARKAGIRNAKFYLSVFCDDDNRLQEDFLKIAVQVMRRDPDIGALGGKGIATSSIEFPKWFDEKKGSYAVGEQATVSGDLSERRYLWGAGLVLRTQLFKGILDAGFDFWCGGRKGDQLTAGDDSEICRWILLAGYKLWYDDRLVYKHYIHPKRLTTEYFEGMMQGFLAGNKLINIYDIALDNIANPQSNISKFFMSLKLWTNVLWYYFKDKHKLFHYRFELQQLYPNNRALVVKPQYQMIFDGLKNLKKN